MEIKRNEATKMRPDGDRLIDAPYVFIDIPAFARQLKEEEAWQKNDRNGITVFKTGHHTIVLTGLHKGALIKDNCIDGLVTLQVIEGRILVKISNEEIEMKEQEILSLHPNICHTVEAVTDALVLLSDYTC